MLSGNSTKGGENFLFWVIPVLFLAGFLFFSPPNAEAEELQDHILDFFPFAINNNYDSAAGRDAGFRFLSLRGDYIPSSNKYDRSLWASNNQSNYPTALSSPIGPVSGSGFSLSWWFAWDNFSGTGFVEALDENQKILLGAFLGKNGNSVYAPEGAGSINWDKYNLTTAEMGDGNWHQFILASDGTNIKLYFDGQERSSGSFAQPIDYTGKTINYLWLSGSGDKFFDEVILWDKFLSAADAAEIYNQKSFYDFPVEVPVQDLTAGKIKTAIIDAFPFNSEYPVNSINGLANGFFSLTTAADNPFSLADDWSIETVNNQGANWPNPMSGETQPISSRGFSLSWWFQWVDFSGSLSMDVRDQDNRILLSGFWGKNGNTMYAPDGSGGIVWEKYGLNQGVMGDGNWHQFAVASDGANVSIYFDGEEKAKGTFNNAVNYQNRKIKYLWVSGSGTKNFDEIVFWDKFLTPNDAQLIKNYGSVGMKPTHNPVIIVPGIEGSVLKEREFLVDNEIWPDPLTYIADPIDQQLKRLEMDERGNSKNNIFPSDAIRSVIWFDFYGGLIDYLKTNGREENKNLYIFPYDWRLDLDEVAGNNDPCESTTTLRCLIEEAKRENHSDKVDIVAHSMGGLVVKDYVVKFGQDSIDKFIDIATPHLGAPKAAKILEYGDNLGFGFLIFGLNVNTIKEISLRMPSVYQLLPSEKYFNIYNNGYGYYLYNDSKIGGPTLQGELNYLQSLSYLVASDNQTTPFFVNKNSLLHSQIDNVEIANSYNISGCGTPTIGKIKNLGKKAFFWDKYEIEYIDGDGTVPLRSADYYGDDDRKYYLKGGEHSKIPGDQDVKDFVYLILNNEEDKYPFSPSSHFYTDDSICGISGKTINYNCPVEMHIYDEQGNHTGPTENGDIENNIPGVQYDVIEGNKFVFLPEGKNYRVTGEAVGTGTLEVAIRTIENSQCVNTEYFNGIPLNSTSTRTEINLVSGQDNSVVKIDENGDGIFEEEKIPDAVLSGEEMDDLIKPDTDITTIGTKGKNDYYVSDIEISLSANDDNSGVLKTEYSLDNGKNWIKYEGEFAISQSGAMTILYSSTDRAGNREENKEAIIKIDKIVPEISVLIPQENQEFLRSEKLTPEYFIDDNFSGVASDTFEIYFDGEIINANIIDLFRKNLGQHQIQIIVKDLAGNQGEETVDFLVIADVDGTIVDANRAYVEGMINRAEAKNGLVGGLTEIKVFQEKYGQRIEKEKEMREKALVQCLKYKDQTWCEKRIGKTFDRIEYQLNKINQAIIKLKYNLILVKLDLYLRAKWINQDGYSIIKEDIKYLLSKI